MKRPLTLAIALLAVLPLSAFAHKAWLQPSETVLAGESAWITVDAAVSNDLFYFDHMPMRLDSLVITAPDGTTVAPENAATGKLRSVFDLELKQEGTYKVAVVMSGLNASWDDGGKPKRWRGNAATFATEVPKDAKDLKVSQNLTRIETFATKGSPSLGALKASGKGIELLPVTHPNDLFAGEPATFKLLLDGKPAKGLSVEIIRGATRYRNAQDEVKATTDAAGAFTVTLKEPGMYRFETTSEDTRTDVEQAKQRRLGYSATLEVLPQ